MTIFPLTKFLFGPSFICQILMIFSFLESIWHKKTDCTSFAREIGKLAENNMSKDIFTILVFLNYTSGYISNFANVFAYLKWHGQVLFNNVFLIIFDFWFFCKHFYYLTAGFGKKVEHKSFPMIYYLSYLDI